MIHARKVVSIHRLLINEIAICFLKKLFSKNLTLNHIMKGNLSLFHFNALTISILRRLGGKLIFLLFTGFIILHNHVERQIASSIMICFLIFTITRSTTRKKRLVFALVKRQVETDRQVMGKMKTNRSVHRAARFVPLSKYYIFLNSQSTSLPYICIHES